MVDHAAKRERFTPERERRRLLEHVQWLAAAMTPDELRRLVRAAGEIQRARAEEKTAANRARSEKQAGNKNAAKSEPENSCAPRDAPRSTEHRGSLTARAIAVGQPMIGGAVLVGAGERSA